MQYNNEYNYKTIVEKFANVMQSKLFANHNKGGWQKCSNTYLLKRLKEEVTEIEEALINREVTEKIIAECADVANFAMMIADNLTAQNKYKGILNDRHLRE